MHELTRSVHHEIPVHHGKLLSNDTTHNTIPFPLTIILSHTLVTVRTVAGVVWKVKTTTLLYFTHEMCK